MAGRRIGEFASELREKGIFEDTMLVFVTDNGWCIGLVSKGSAFEKSPHTGVLRLARHDQGRAELRRPDLDS